MPNNISKNVGYPELSRTSCLGPQPTKGKTSANVGFGTSRRGVDNMTLCMDAKKK
jgi:hypothetical protein